MAKPGWVQRTVAGLNAWESDRGMRGSVVPGAATVTVVRPHGRDSRAMLPSPTRRRNRPLWNLRIAVKPPKYRIEAWPSSEFLTVINGGNVSVNRFLTL
jgi:hypothetical protein